MIDLHTHSDRSDGSESPERIVELAHLVGCRAVALTDHDTLDGLPGAAARAGELGIRLVPGCEVSCVPVAGGGVHVLVYFVDDPTSPLGVELARLRHDRAERNDALVARLEELGIPVTLEAAAAHAGTASGVGRPHFAQAMVDVGVVDTVDEAFERFLGNGGSAYVPKGRLTVADVAGLARSSGGVAVLAHPFTIGLDGDALATAVRGMADDGLVGLEAVYGRYSPRQRTDLGNLARRFGLVPTGGSDFHGATKPDLAVGTGTGDLRVTDRVLDLLEAAAGRLTPDGSVGHGSQVIEEVGEPAPPGRQGLGHPYVDQVVDDDAVAARGSEHPEPDTGVGRPGQQLVAPRGADDHTRRRLGEELVVVGDAGHPQSDTGPHGELGQGHAEPPSRHVVEAVDRSVAAGHGLGHQIGHQGHQAAVSGEVEGRQRPVAVVPELHRPTGAGQ